MLQVVNLTKIYKTKNGVDVKALDGVNLQFPETGMVFLLGKSGSGKSTLLNVCGGLDTPTDGEVVVKGRSSKLFSQSDFDSYRNTFIGFIFQEYNILNEFSVEDNIALALELQGKPKDKAAINALLEQVDLSGYAKRKPNTLSGGQKQRIAIARALVKSPEIIMADEPTGALDSTTGKQVFDTLKKLSKDKLVIVVSHDRDFAEQYGDRIIELQDGKVLSDVSKTQLAQQPVTENIQAVGDVLCVKKGASLTDVDFDTIKQFLEKATENVIIAADPKDVDTFKKVSRINDDGAKEVFAQTNEPTRQKAYTPEDSRFIRSKLPIKHAFKIGVSSLKSKPVRLAFTALLCTVAFVMFGLLSTLSFYDSESTFRQTMLDGGQQMMAVGKEYEIIEKNFVDGEEGQEYTYFQNTRFSSQELTQFQSQFGEDVFGGISADGVFNVQDAGNRYWSNAVTLIASLPETHKLRGEITGRYPNTKEEILLTNYTATALLQCKVYDAQGKSLDLQDSGGLIGKKLNLSNHTYTVVGIVNVGEVPEEYRVLQDGGEIDQNLLMKYEEWLRNSLCRTAFVTQTQLNCLAEETPVYYQDDAEFRRIVAVMPTGTGPVTFPEWSNGVYVGYGDVVENSAVYTFGNKKQPGDNEVLLSKSAFFTWLNEMLSQKGKEIQDANPDDWEKAEGLWQLSSKSYELLEGEYYNDKGEAVPLTKAEWETRVSSFMKQVSAKVPNLKLQLKLFDSSTDTATGEVREYTVIGFADSAAFQNKMDRVIVSDQVKDALWEQHRQLMSYYYEMRTDYIVPVDAIYDVVYLPYDGGVEQLDVFWQMYDRQQPITNGARAFLSGSAIEQLRMVDSMIHELSVVFLYIGLVMAAFAALLFSNFISVSISQKTREIGILRAVGARSIDVFKIFFSESFCIAAGCVVLATVGSMVVCSVLNTSLAEGLGASFLVFGPISFMVLVGIALLTAVVATFLPVYNAAKKKPVDSIRSL